MFRAPWLNLGSVEDITPTNTEEHYMATSVWHFPKETVKFLKDLKKNNNRDWFNENRKRYESAVRDPAEEFAERMTAAMSELTGAEITSKIFRIHRDVRFSKDKTPYNAHVHITFYSPENKKLTAQGCSTPHWYFGLDTERVVLGAGVFGFEKDELIRYRQRIDGKEGETLQKLLDKLTKKGLTMHEPALKRVPSGFDKEHPRGALLRRKGLAVWNNIGKPSLASEGNLITLSRKTLKEMQPLVDWLAG